MRPRRAIRRRSTGPTSSRSDQLGAGAAALLLSHGARPLPRGLFCALTGSQDLVTFWACHRAGVSSTSAVSRASCSTTAPRPSSARTSGANGRSVRTAVPPGGARLGASLRVLDAALSRPTGQDQGQGRARRPLRPRAAAARATPSPATSRPTRRGRSWNEDVARQRVHGTHGEIVADRGRARPRRAAGPLPPTTTWSSSAPRRVVARDGFFSFEGRRYAGPRRARRASASSSSSAPPRSRSTRLLDGRRLATPRARPARQGAARPGRRTRCRWRRCSDALPDRRGAPPPAVGLPGPHRWLS